MARKAKIAKEMTFEEVRQAFLGAINNLCLKVAYEDVSSKEDRQTAVKDVEKWHYEFCKRFNAPINYEGE